jgi:hypothetical protein
MGAYEMGAENATPLPDSMITTQGNAASLSIPVPILAPGESFTAYALFTWEGLQVRGNRRQVSFRFQSPFDVANTVLKVTEPAGAMEMTITPEPAFRLGEHTAVHILPITGVQAGQELALDVQYTPRTQPGAVPTQLGSRITVGVLSAVLAVGLGIALWQGVRRRAAAAPGKE